MSDPLKDRGRGLEDAFFAKQDALLRQKLAEQRDSQGRRAALSEASGITDEALLDKLIAADISPALLAAITLVPPVLVAWADGQIDAAERAALLDAAAKAGLTPDSPGHALFQGWLGTRPPAHLLDLSGGAAADHGPVGP